MEASVAIILVNYNGYEDTVECVESLLQINYKNFQIYVVDNCSADAKKIKSDPFLSNHAKLIFTEQNLGFSGGNNVAINDALDNGTDYIVLLNNDTTVEPDFLSSLIGEIEKSKEIGAVTGKIYFYYNRDKVWSAGGQYDRNTGLTIQYSGVDNESFDDEKEITFATGCLLMVSSEVVRKIGLMDESYFLYSEDSDFCQRIIDAGYKIMYTPKSVIYHKVSASTGDRSPLQQRYMMRNNLYMIKKYSPTRVKAYVKISWQMFKHIVRGRRDLKPSIQGYMDFIKGKIGRIA